MALFRFRTRNPNRDRQTDVSRFAGIRQALDDVRAEIERERDGFQRRYDEVAMNAAFSLENIENEGENEKISAKVDDYAQALKNFTQRIAFLEKQITFLKGVDETMAEFADENGLGRADAVSDASA
ncbi:hypothetical protein ATN84_11240 [Paramesorhizobium deserti]|uniref:Uncharacterized protein n=1 Tax=Paramesorhizobium deserti TaxID=1494590 RepID=A0A135HTV3_9HYPH|nr:hypothetical protein [Paramesorhizobium deserti]KXF76622.1 hypothetical protein ATN84_11240 [Paramesorhizobium deserti]